MDEWKLERSENFVRVRDDMAAFATEMAERDWSSLGAGLRGAAF